MASGEVEPQSRLMLVPSGVTPIGNHLGAQFPEDLRRNLVGSAVGAVEDNAQPSEGAALWKGVLDELDVAAVHVVQPLGPAELRRGASEFAVRPLSTWPSMLLLDFVRQLDIRPGRTV